MQDRKQKRTQVETTALPPIPDKRYFTIGEVSRLCALKAHVLRYWEQEFPQLTPSKRRGNRRYYQRDEVMLIRDIRNLLYDRGFTIEGARAQLSKEDNSETEGNRVLQYITSAISDLESLALELEGV